MPRRGRAGAATSRLWPSHSVLTQDNASNTAATSSTGAAGTGTRTPLTPPILLAHHEYASRSTRSDGDQLPREDRYPRRRPLRARTGSAGYESRLLMNSSGHSYAPERRKPDATPPIWPSHQASNSSISSGSFRRSFTCTTALLGAPRGGEVTSRTGFRRR